MLFFHNCDQMWATALDFSVPDQGNVPTYFIGQYEVDLYDE